MNAPNRYGDAPGEGVAVTADVEAGLGVGEGLGVGAGVCAMGSATPPPGMASL